MKARPLDVDLKVKIAKHKIKHGVSYKQLSQLFGVEYDQARNACIDYESGKLKQGRQKQVKNVGKIIEEKTPEEIFNRQLHTALAQLDSEKKMSSLTRIAALDKLAKIRKTAQSIELERHLKRADADIIAAIIRRYEPEATSEDIIKIYREEIEKIKND